MQILRQQQGSMVSFLSHQINVFKNKSDVFFEKAALTKHFDWQYEKEWRFISSLNKNILIKNNLISSIYFGVNINKEDKDDLIELIRKEYKNTKIFSTKKNQKIIKLNTREIKKQDI